MHATGPVTAQALALEAVLPGDDAAFYQLFAAVRAEELGMQAWEPGLRDGLLRLQFIGQRRAYRERFPASTEHVLVLDGRPIGWIVADRAGACVRCVDIAVIAEHRSRGVGTLVLRSLQEEAARSGRTVALSVLRTNERALALYLRLGFRPVGGTDLHAFMEWRGDAAGADGEDVR